jgi:hypothetical protein
MIEAAFTREINFPTTLDVREIRQKYTRKAYFRLGIRAENWRTELGFKANLPILEALYYAYQSYYFDSPNRFLWAGLARLTGGQVLFGMGNLTKIIKDPCVLSQEIVAIAKDIYDNLAWQHELFLDDPNLLISVCEQLDKMEPATHKFADCWRLIGKNDVNSIALGNRMLLENEQHNTVQPHYERIKLDNYSRPFFWFTRFAMRNIHPYHPWFFVDLPFRDVTVFENRWQWISQEKGMWQTWAALKRKERDRLVGLTNESVKNHKW